MNDSLLYMTNNNANNEINRTGEYVVNGISCGIFVILLIYTIVDAVKNKKVNKVLIVIDIIAFIHMIFNLSINCPYVPLK